MRLSARITVSALLLVTAGAFGLMVIGMHVDPLLQLATAGLPLEARPSSRTTQGQYLLHAEKIRASLARPYDIDGHHHDSSPSIGVTLFHGEGDSVDALLQQADAAMYRAKSRGRNQVDCYEPHVSDGSRSSSPT